MASPPELDVVVIGAGAAGLAACVALEQGGLRVMCLEARDRIGGRIFTKRDPLVSLPIELGAEFIHGSPPELMEIVESGNLLVGNVSFHPRTRRKGEWVPEGEDTSGMWEALEQAQEYTGPDVSWAEFARSIQGLETAIHAATRYVEGFNAARSEVISVASIAQDLRAAQELGESSQFRVLSGYDQVPSVLARRLRDPRKSIRLRRTVESIVWERNRVSLGIVDEPGRIMARAAVVTLPVSLLQQGTLRISPTPNRCLEAAGEIAMGQVFRVTFHFGERFWDKVKGLADAGFLFSDEDLFPTWWTSLPVRNSMITGWSAGPHADRLMGHSADEVARDALETLARITGVGRDTLQEQMCGWHFHDWHSDPFSRGAYSYSQAGRLDARSRLAEPVDNTLFFAGEATETDGHSGTVHGAIASGRRAARQVLEGWR